MAARGNRLHAEPGVQTEADGDISTSDMKDIWAMFVTGARVLMCSFLLHRLLMVLAMNTVNNSTSDGVMSYDEVLKALKAARAKCAKRPHFNVREDMVLDLLKELCKLDTLSERHDIQGSLKQIVCTKNDIVQLRGQMKKGRSYWQSDSFKSGKKPQPMDKALQIQESTLFNSAINEFDSELLNVSLELKDGDHSQDLRLKLKIGAVHEVCISLGIGWALFENVEDCGYLFCNVSETDNSVDYETTGQKQTAFEVIDYLSNSRHCCADCDHLDGGEGHIKEFLVQFDSLTDLLCPYLKDVTDEMSKEEKRAFLKYSFPEATTTVTDDTGNRLRGCYPNLREILDRRSELMMENRQRVSKIKQLNADSEQRDVELFHLIEDYYAQVHQQNAPLQDHKTDIYHRLLALIKNLELLLQRFPQAGQPMADLQAIADVPAPNEAEHLPRGEGEHDVGEGDQLVEPIDIAVAYD